MLYILLKSHICTYMWIYILPSNAAKQHFVSAVLQRVGRRGVICKLATKYYLAFGIVGKSLLEVLWARCVEVCSYMSMP